MKKQKGGRYMKGKRGRSGKKLVAMLMAVIMFLEMIWGGGFGSAGLGNVKAEALINIADAAFSALQTKKTYTGKEITIAFGTEMNIIYLNKVIPSNCYDVSYSNNINAGKATVTLTGKKEKGYFGTISEEFDINPVKGSETTIYYMNAGKKEKWEAGTKLESVYNKNTEYSDRSFEDIAISWNGKELVQGIDYTTVLENYEVNEKGLTLSVDFQGNYSGTVTRTVIVHAADISKQTIRLKNGNSYKYTGKEIKPEVIICDSQSGEKLVMKGDDTSYPPEYEVSYKNNTNVGTGTVVIKGLDGYTGTTEIPFHIIDAGSSLEDISSAAVSVSACEYTGNAVEPSVTVTYNGKKLTKGTDYDVSYANNINAYYYDENYPIVIISGKGKYIGGIIKKFEISRRNISNVTVRVSPVTYSPSRKDYSDLVWEIKDEALGKVLKIGKTEGDCSVTTDNDYTYKAGTHTGKITGLVGSNYTGSKSITFEILPKDISSAKITVAQQKYTGSAVQPKCTVEVDNIALTEGTDYEITGYENNTNIGTAIVNVKGKGNYSGTAQAGFQIISEGAKDISTLTITPSTIPNQNYTGSQICPEVTVKDGNTTLIKGTDYVVVYGENTNSSEWAPKGKVTIIGKGKYYGEVSKEFGIKSISLFNNADVVVKLNEDTYEYTGSKIEPDVEVTWKGIPLVLGKDYSIEDVLNSGYNRKDVGEQQAWIYGRKGTKSTKYSNYKDAQVVSFKIVEPDIVEGTFDDVKVSGIADAYEYTGKAICPEVKLTLEDDAQKSYTLKVGTDYTVTYTNNTAVGTATMTLTGKGRYSGTKKFNYSITARDVELCDISIAKTSYEYMYQPIEPAVAAKNGSISMVKDLDYTVEYSNNENPGNATVVVTGKGNYKGTRTFNFTITKIPVTSSNVSVSQINATYDYTGKAISPAVTLRYSGKQLKENVDYTLAYKNNVSPSTSTSKASVTITGIGVFTGTRTISYSIVKNANLADCNIEAIPEQTYTGQAICPELRITGNGETLVKDVDYTVQYADNVEPGTAKVTITGKGSYTGTRTVEFTIAREVFNITNAQIANIADQTYQHGNAITPAVTVTCNGKTLEAGTDYTVSYANNRTVGTATVTVTAAGSNTGSKSRTFKILPLQIGNLAKVQVKDAVYTGKAITPDVTVTIGSRTLVKGTDYTIKAANNVSVSGTPTVTITGCGNYTGTLNETFKITAKDIGSCTIGDIAKQTYTGTGITPEVIVRDGSTTLVKGTDYTVSYANNINVTTSTAKARVTITGKGNYKGTQNVTFEITGRTISDTDIAAISNMTYTGGEIKPEPVVTTGGKTLTKDKDYTVSYENNVKVTGNDSKAYVVVSGKGNYSGKARRAFTITAKNIAACDIDAIPGQIYTGSAITPAITVRNGSIVLKKDTDYTVRYENNINLTTSGAKAKAVITGKGNYTGTATKEFTIAREVFDISNAKIANIADQTYRYGEAIKPAVTVTCNGKTLEAGIDYEVVYTNNDKAGTAKVTVNAAGSNTGSVSKTFKILPLNITNAAKCQAGDMVYTGKAVTPNMTVTIGNRTLQKGTDYTVSVKNNVSVSDKPEITITGCGNYTGSIKGTFAIKAKNITDCIIDVNSRAVYTGKSITPTVVIANGAVNLVSGRDYEISYRNNVDVTDNASVVITGKGNYTGTDTKIFEIVKRNIGEGSIAAIKNVVYTGAELKPEIIVTVAGNKLDTDDYDVQYIDNMNVGTAKVVVTGKGNYTGTLNAVFNIVSKDEPVPPVVTVGKVTGFKSTSSTTTTITLAWNKVNDATGYKIAKYDTAKKKYVELKTVDAKTLKYTISGLKAGTKYTFRVNAYRTADGKNVVSEAAGGTFATKAENKVGAVTGLKFVKRSKTSIKFKWNKVSGADGYFIYRYDKKTRKYVRIKDVPGAGKTTFVSTRLKSGTTYSYKVCAYKKSGTNKVAGKAAILQNTTTPKAPGISLATQSKKAVVKWKKVTGASGYVIYMSDSAKGKYKRIGIANSSKKVRYIKSGLKSGNTYYFKVKAYKKYNGKKIYSSYSKAKKIKVK